jgi:hypothetical protein
MMRFVSAWLLGLALCLQPAAAQQQEPSVASVRATLADMAEWMIEYSTVLDHGAELMNNLDDFALILERFEDGDINQRTALSQLERWRVTNRTEFEVVRVMERNLRRPPSIADFGPSAAPLEFALHTARDNLAPVLDEIAAVLEASASMGVEAVRGDPGKTFEVRERAFYQSSIQLVRIDLRRVEIQGAALERDHPNQPLMTATQHFYAALMAMPSHELARLDGENPDRGALAVLLRQSAREMRVHTGQSAVLASRMRETMRWSQSAELAPLSEMIVRLMDTFPASVVAYNGLADGVDAAAACVERGDATLQCWTVLDTQTRAPLEEIGRLERVRAELIARAQAPSL